MVTLPEIFEIIRKIKRFTQQREEFKLVEE